MKKIILVAIFFLIPLISSAKEGFNSSYNKNVFMIKGSTSGATIFLVNLPSNEQVLMTQVHVLDEFGQDAKLLYGIKFGWFFREEARNDDAFELSFKQEIIWKDNDLDVAILKVPDELIEKCKCGGLEVAPYQDGQALLIGYPIIGRRTYPRIGKFWHE